MSVKAFAFSASAAALLAAIAMAPGAKADNLVRNSSFEDDGFSSALKPPTDWTVVGARIGATSQFYTYLAMGTTGSVGQAYQTINTVPGQQYVFGFNFSGRGSPGSFTASWTNGDAPANPITVFQASNFAYDANWDKGAPDENGRLNGYSFIETATSSTTVIDFAAETSGGFVGVDGVNVYALPAGGVSLPGVVTGLPGGLPYDPTTLSGPSIAEIVGGIGGAVTSSFYGFHWNGGAFEATSNVTGADLDPSSSYYFTLLGDGKQSTLLDLADHFTSRISVADLAPGNYEIGLTTDSTVDPQFTINFARPVAGVPEPATWTMMLTGFGALGVLLRLRRRKVIPA